MSAFLEWARSHYPGWNQMSSVWQAEFKVVWDAAIAAEAEKPSHNRQSAPFLKCMCPTCGVPVSECPRVK
jgi:hypothetical protein